MILEIGIEEIYPVQMERMVSTSGYIYFNDLVCWKWDNAAGRKKTSRIGDAAKDLEHDRNIWGVVRSAVEREL